jgi:uncharacterized phage protein (TIGR01671 family)
MREILFRGKRSDNGNWICGSLFTRVNEAYIIPLPIITSKSKVDPGTVGQFTGLFDKNGKKIFEGDVISCNGKTGYVNYESGCFCVHEMGHSKNNPAIDIVMSINSVKVIGNIHDDPELLEV